MYVVGYWEHRVKLAQKSVRQRSTQYISVKQRLMTHISTSQEWTVWQISLYRQSSYCLRMYKNARQTSPTIMLYCYIYYILYCLRMYKEGLPDITDYNPQQRRRGLFYKKSWTAANQPKGWIFLRPKIWEAQKQLSWFQQIPTESCQTCLTAETWI